jgi:hypothetical protein
MGNQKTQWSKKSAPLPTPEKKGPYAYPSRFGSHASMVVKRNEAAGTCVCEDEYGRYKTTIDRLDDKLADPNRYAESRLSKLLGGAQKEEEEVDC